MNYGKALEILDTMDKLEYSEEEKVEAFNKVRSMATTNAVTKKMLWNVIDWLICKQA